MRLQGDTGQVLTIERYSFGDPGTPADEDLLLNVAVTVGGYSAADQTWIVSRDWRKFLSELRELERLRQGQAKLEGPGPNDLELVLKAMDRAGHMAVVGFMGWDSPDGFSQKLEFGFGFDAGMLRTVVEELEALGR